MLRVVLSAWVTKTTAAEILANPATRRRQVTMTISLNPLRSTKFIPLFLHNFKRLISLPLLVP